METEERLKSAVKGKKLLLIGPPGSGKGNRSRDLEELGLVHVSSGIALRAKVRDEPDSGLSQKAFEFMQRGELVPDDIIIPILMELLTGEKCQEKGFALDGFPRTKSQAEVLFSQINIDLVLYLDVPRQFLLYGIVEGNRRICENCAAGYSDFDSPQTEGVCDKCGGKLLRRVDDKTKTIENRLKLYDKQIHQLLPYIQSKARVVRLPITVKNEEKIDEKYLKKLKGKVYRIETYQGSKARMLNLKGMRMRLHNLLSQIFL